MTSFWGSFSPAFTRNPQITYSDDFKLLAAQRGWKPGGSTYRKQWIRCCEEEFRAQYGHDGRLEGWRTLCADVGIRDIPNSATQCKKVLNRTWVNLVDLIECRANGTQVAQHRSQRALRMYTKETGKIFPKVAAKQNGFLKALLITMY